MIIRFFALAASFAVPVACAQAQQSQYDINAQINQSRTGSITFTGGLTLPLKTAWVAKPGQLAAAPLIANGVVYILGNDQNEGGPLSALDLATGKKLWSKPLGIGTIDYDQGRLFFTSSGGQLQAFAATTGVPLWITNIPGAGGYVNTVAYKGNIYALGYDSTASAPAIYQYNEATGAQNWKADLPAVVPGGFGPTIDIPNSALVYSANGVATSLDLATGTERWTTVVPSASCPYVSSAPVAVYTNKVFAPSMNCTTGYVLNARTGAPISALNTYTAVLANNMQYGDYNGQELIATGAQTGNLLWSYAPAGIGFTNPIAVNNVVFAYGSNAKLYALNGATGKVMQIINVGFGDLYPSTSGLAAGEGYVVVPSGNTLVAYTSMN
jgi:outer membrane protein assembly factor BamB